jgi:hypothetical protein
MDSAASGIMLEATATQGQDSSGSYDGVIAPVQPAPKVATPEDYSFVIEDILRMLQEPRSKDWLAEKLSVSPVRMKKWLDRAVQEGSPSIGFAMRVLKSCASIMQRKTGRKRERCCNR